MADQAKTIIAPEGSFLLDSGSPAVCFESMKVLGSAGGVDVDNCLGYPVKADGTLALEADSAAGVHGWICENEPLNIGAGLSSEKPMKILVRGPAAINKNLLPANDPAGTPFTEANLVAAAEAVGIAVKDEPLKQEIQTT